MRILFVCPHAAGKSLLAATYASHAVAAAGLDASVDVAGPDPDPVNMPNVVAALEAEGLQPVSTPRRIRPEDTAAADLVVSIGCPIADIPTDGDVRFWDVPMLSDDFAGSVAAIRDHVDELVSELASRRGANRRDRSVSR